MKKFFVVGIEPMTAEQDRSFIEYLRGLRVGWWHWIPNFWLVTGNTEAGCSEIRDELDRIAPGNTNLVLEVDPINWAGFGPTTDERNMFVWLNTFRRTT
jgi:hypothetical protein